MLVEKNNRNIGTLHTAFSDAEDVFLLPLLLLLLLLPLLLEKRGGEEERITRTAAEEENKSESFHSERFQFGLSGRTGILCSNFSSILPPFSHKTRVTQLFISCSKAHVKVRNNKKGKEKPNTKQLCHLSHKLSIDYEFSQQYLMMIRHH